MTLPPARDLRLYERRVFLRRVGIALINTLFQMDGRLFHQREDLLKRLRCPLVIEHIGKFLEPVPPHPGFQSLLRLADSGRCWVKLSGAYMLSTAGPPYYPDIGVLGPHQVLRRGARAPGVGQQLAASAAQPDRSARRCRPA